MFNVLRQGSVVGVLAIGMTFVIATAGIDLSVGSMVAAAAIAGGWLCSTSDSWTATRRCGSSLGSLALRRRCSGAVNGAAVAYGKVVPFIATLAMLLIARGLALWISDKTPISLFDLKSLRWFGTGEVLTIPSSLIVFFGGRRDRLGASEPHPVRPLRRRGRRQPRGRPDRRREGPTGSCSASTC